MEKLMVEKEDHQPERGGSEQKPLGDECRCI